MNTSGLAIGLELDRLTDLLDEYFQEVRRYNRAIGAYDMTAEELRDARAREAQNFARLQKVRQKLVEAGVPI